MSKTVKISDENYKKIEEIAFKNGVKIQHLLDEVLSRGLIQAKQSGVVVLERGRHVDIVF